MRRTILSLIGAAHMQILAQGDPPEPPLPSVPDPRASQGLTLMYRNGEQAIEPVGHALLVFARWDTKHPTTILGVNGWFTDEQIIVALKRFYREWHPPQNDPSVH